MRRDPRKYLYDMLDRSRFAAELMQDKGCQHLQEDRVLRSALELIALRDDAHPAGETCTVAGPGRRVLLDPAVGGEPRPAPCATARSLRS